MARYGQSIGDIPTETFGPVRGFALREYLVGVKFLNGTSAMEMISRNDQAEIKLQEIDALLKKHGPTWNGKWINSKNQIGNDGVIRTDLSWPFTIRNDTFCM